ncbi:hypothetical protein FOCC_FOCC016416 [Frankliniella occidentalis]|nr:hypothetical protein FOCC_FOCC016416 [Frankliniella occidentalis]
MASEDEEAEKKRATPRDNRRTGRFEILKLPGQPARLTAKKKKTDSPNKPTTFFLVTDDLHDVLTNAHRQLSHWGMHRRVAELKRKWANVTEETVLAYSALCPTCVTRNPQRRGLTVRPIVHRQMNDRVQFDLIGMQSAADGEFKFILHIQDHLTKFVHLRALKQKTAAEVAEHLIDILLEFGAPCILYSDNGQEFRNALVTSLKETWPELRIVHGL